MNPVKHGLTDKATNYPFGSYRWFVEQGHEVLQQQVFAQPIDRVKFLTIFEYMESAGKLADSILNPSARLHDLPDFLLQVSCFVFDLLQLLQHLLPY